MIMLPKREYPDLPTLDVDIADEMDDDHEPLYEVKPVGEGDGNRARWSLRTLREWWDYERNEDDG